MAGNDATSSELFPGWSSVVHQPADELEESDLPSTVDITAFSTGLNVEIGATKHDDGNSDSESDSEADSSNSGTDASQSGSQSDSSDSDSSTSSQESSSHSGRSSPSPEFSVTSSQTDGLRLTIATVRKQSPSGEKNMNKPVEQVKNASKSPTSSSDSGPSSDSESESEKNKSGSKNDKKSEPVKNDVISSKVETSPNKISVKNTKDVRQTIMKTRRKVVEKKDEKVVKNLKKEIQSQGATKSGNGKVRQRRRTRKMASLPLSRGSTYSSSDSDDSDTDGMLASCSLQEIREEDLAAILPDQQEIDAFDFECNRNDKNSPATGDMSGSDMELPQQAVNALIQRTTESSSEGEIHAPPNPSSLYANSLLQQFVAQTQMLNAPCSMPGVSDPLKGLLPTNNLEPQNTKVEVENVKRKRGRPKKNDKDSKPIEKAPEYCTNPNVSPDSGIQNSPDHVSSPEPTLSPSIKQKVVPSKQQAHKKLDKLPPKTVKNEKPSLKVANNMKTIPVKSKETNKNSITANRFDRVLYANSDRVLYPPRRKVGRPPVTRKGPGRPPKCKPIVSESQVVKNLEKEQKTVNRRLKNRPVLSVKNKVDVRSKYQTLKVPKIMHDKHKHKKHKKYKFKVLKPITASDPKINIEIDKLIADFIKCCAIATKQPKENVPEQILKTIKKVTKKRKTTEYEKKKKKQSVSVTDNKVNKSNEQRLPLKKRHYHLVSNSENKTEIDEIKKEPEEEVKLEKPKIKQALSVVKVEKPKVGSTTPKSETQKSPVASRYVPVIKSNVTSPKVQNNNNEYEVKDGAKSVGSHIDEAIEACINRFSDKKAVSTPEVVKTPEEKVNASKLSITATTPKKRHRLEMTISAEKLQPDVKSESSSVQEEKVSEKLTPKITIESFITELKVKRNLIPKSPMVEEQKPAEKVEEKVKENTENEQKIKLSPESAKKKVRKRRAINRTGFPTVKKKKKKLPTPETSTPLPIESNPVSICDRVPKEGEEYSKFVQRTEKPEISVSTPVTPEKSKTEDLSSKWELMSECESLPQDERTEFEDDIKPDRMTLRQRDLSPTTSSETRTSERNKLKMEDADTDLEVSLESSIERLRSRLEDRKKRKKSMEKLVERTSGYPKRKLRDVSPASSIEPLAERRLKEEQASASGDEKRGRRAPKWRKKKYLVAGLFSDYYKEDDEAIRQKRAENAQKPSRIVYNPAEHPYGLLPPPHHCGKYLRSRRVPFQLPYDIWWQHTHSQLPGRDIVPSWNYRKIRTNVYNVKTTTGACEPQSCNCKPSSNCGDDCINRLVLSECPASHRCQNQRIQRHEWAPGIEKFMTEVKGWGVRTKQPIKSGEFILEYVGEVVTDQEFKERMGTIYTQDTHHYCLHLDGGLLIDGHRMGGDGRFVNHSCAPNCEMQKWSVNGQFRMALFALRNIEAGEELTYDYNFSLFNPADGQECKCGSELCRGVIGGKSQRVRQLPEPNVSKNPGRVGRPRKTEAKKKASSSKDVEKVPVVTPVLPTIQVKPMSHQQKCFILEHHCFLLRNLSKVRKVRDRSLSMASAGSRQQTATPTDTSAFMNHLNALQKPRSMKTRGLAQVEDDPELNKTVKLAALLKKIWTTVINAKDEKGESLSAHFMTMPSKRKVPEFYTRLTNPIDLSTIEQNIATGIYKTPESFDEDFNKLFRDYIRFYGRTSEMGIGAAKLKKIYVDSKKQSLNKFEDALGAKPPPNFVSNRKKSEEEDIIRCICGIPRDEGLMIQCERCLVWQHCECVKAYASAPSYHCEKCVPREVDYEIPLDEFTEHGHRYYMTLMRGDLQLRQGDTVYVLRDIPIPGTDKKHTYDTIEKIEYSELDIFRIERLWKEEKTGKRLAYGHHYLRPHETFHEPTRKFFPNEVMRVPLYEAVPVELVISHCWVMDVNTYCKGRPIGAPKEHIYICEYRVDKGAKMFTKVPKSKFPICTKTFAFERFESRLKLSRTYCPHDVDAALMKSVGRKQKNNEDAQVDAGVGSTSREVVTTVPVLPPVVRTPAEQKARLNRILLNLLSKMPTKQVIDVSYLLEGGRRRKKPVDNVNK
ncbi:histone-lysine N-methyltransferase ash1 isoform X1 [Leptinotarsa decemlineata]|uniref:histone-lysine N-methyltransferase ash1 isoform X1 n=1 Tax=Leptinotarsa decemlineata TaxID=7539 RepID=UPI003D30645C